MSVFRYSIGGRGAMDNRLTDLAELQSRIESTDLIPSQRVLLDGLGDKMDYLKRAGIHSLADLRVRLKNKGKLENLAKDSGIDADYLTVLRRYIEGLFPRPRPLKAFDWIDKDLVAKLEAIEIKNTQQLYEARSSNQVPAQDSDFAKRDMKELAALSDLSRIQWVSPVFSRTLIAAGYDSAEKVSKAKPQELYEALLRANEDARFYRGTVGLRDIKRLIAMAAFQQS